MMKKTLSFVVLVSALMTQPLCAQQETLPPLKDGIALQTFEALWAGYDPRVEPLDIEILKAWEEDGVMLRIVRYRIGIFKGQKAMMAAVYGYPKGAQNLPGLVQIHGGGQYAHANAVFTNAKRGYATISIAWAGRIDAPGYRVTSDVVKLFWDGRADEPKYKLTTDWGALDAYHAPCRNPKNAFAHVTPASWTLDKVESPRNNPWFLVTLGARRALTFLEKQPQVDADKLGVYGHSMGGKLTVLTTAADSRVKAAVPSCGGLSNRATDNALYDATIGDDANLKHIACPIMFLSPSNDFHGRINDLQKALREIASEQWRVTCSPHHNHQDTPEYEVATQLWFDQTLKGIFTCPDTPKTSLQLNNTSGVPSLSVKPDMSKPILCVDIYYTQQGQKEGEKNDHENTMNRFWRHVPARQNGHAWTAGLSLASIDKPLWVYANVLYRLDKPVTGAGYYYGIYKTDQFNLSSIMHTATTEELHASRARVTLAPSLMIETFAGDWEKEWFTYKPADWARRTHKVYDPQWRAPVHGCLALDVRTDRPNKLVMGINQYAAEISLKGGDAWQSIILSAQDFRSVGGGALTSWQGIKELRLGAQETLRPKRGDTAKPLTLGGIWQGEKPEFRHLRWIPEKARHYPAFSWETVPIGFHFGKSESLMTEEEAEFVASHASFICLEKGHAGRQFKYTEDGIEQEARQLKKINPNMKVIFYNGIRSTPSKQIGNDFMDDTDAVMIEHFGHFNSGSKECMLKDIQEMTKAGKHGKIVVFKAWPGFAWIDKAAMRKPLEEKRRLAAENMTFPLAAFLVGAQEHAYFIYNWSYRMELGCLEWYPELDKKLGPPLMDAKQTGWNLEREFEYASVWIDLEAKEARIDWR